MRLSKSNIVIIFVLAALGYAYYAKKKKQANQSSFTKPSVNKSNSQKNVDNKLVSSISEIPKEWIREINRKQPPPRVRNQQDLELYYVNKYNLQVGSRVANKILPLK